MKEDCVSFEQAKALKELGFPLTYCTDVHTYEEPWSGLVEYVQETNYDKPILPSLYLVQKWLREERNIAIYAFVNNDRTKYLGWSYEVVKDFKNGGWENTIVVPDKSCETYEKALSAGIDRCIELLKER